MAGYRALIIEDSAVMRGLLARVLKTHVQFEGWDEASDGIEALRMIMSSSYDLLLVDLNLPRLDGLKLIERVRGSENAARTKIVVVTTDAAEEDRARAMQLGADAYLLKPVQLPELKATLDRLFEA